MSAKTNSLLLLMAMFFYTETIKPITQESVNTGSTIAALITGFSAYITFPYPFRLFSLLSVGGITFYATRYCLNYFTPNGRMERAENHLMAIVGYAFANIPLAEKESLFSQIYSFYVYNASPLTQAVSDLNYFIRLSATIIGLIDAALEEDASLTNYALILKNSAKNYALQMKNILSIIISSKEYIEERHHQEMLHVQQSIAEAQWNSALAQQQIAARV